MINFFRSTRRRVAAVAIAAAILGVLFAIGLSGSHSAAVTPVATFSPSTPATSAPAALPSTPSAPATPDLSGPLGTTYTVTGTDANGSPASYDVIADKVLDPAAGADEFNVPDQDSHFVGVKFTINGDTGYSHEDSELDATVQGSDGQVYEPVFDTITAGTNFDAGDFSVSAGQTQAGWLTFDLPDGVSVTSVQWTPYLSGLQPATWTP